VSSPKSVLIIDDDKKLAELLSEFLTKYEFEPRVAGTPELGMAMLRKASPDVVILDVMLPGKSGLEVCKEIRRESTVPIIMLTARGDVTDRIIGLEIGADDYMPKPFEPRELVARIQALLRRQTERPRARIAIGGLVVDPGTRSATLAGAPLDLSTSEFDALNLLAANPGRTFSRDQMIERLKGENWATDHRAVDVLISRLRQKLGDDPKDPKYIKTVWGTGYMFAASQEP
jgi:DNA-binding response OmpR family regulator